jgi:3-hydroxyisobutyrate dehydrogenase-like beta-hydroxyacid dehydrogenase
MSTIGFVGLGEMGAAIAGRLLAAGHQVVGTNRTASKAAPLIERGLIWRDTPSEVAAAAATVFSMVTDDAALAAVTSGQRGILAGLSPGNIYVDMSTVSPAASRELAEDARARGARMLDAPVSGSVPAAQDGTLTIMVGGDEETYLAVEPVLRHLGTVTRVGGNGQGLLLKLAINISLATQMLAFSEGVLLAERGGIDPALAVDVMAGSAVGSPMLTTRAPLILNPPDDAWFDIRLMHKDVRLALETARTLGVPVPTTTVTDKLLTTAGELGYNERDIAVLVEVLAELAESGR